MQKDWFEIIKELRIDCDLTQSDIAKLLNTRQEYYSKYEQGKIELPIRHLKTLCHFYKVSADYILFSQKPATTVRQEDYIRMYQQLSTENQACVLKLTQALLSLEHQTVDS